MRVIRLGTRGSALARWQTDHVAAALVATCPDARITVVEITSRGDESLDVPLSRVEGTGFFTSTLEHALLAGEIDAAVHSYKDLPVTRTPGLTVSAVPSRGPVADALCARGGHTVVTLPRGARVGTCSTRRSAQIRLLRPDLEIVPVRGNVPTRVECVQSGDLDAVVLAHAGLVRLGLTACVTQVFSTRSVLPAPAQGALAVQCRTDDQPLRRALGSLDDFRTRQAVTAERTVLADLGGGCSAPVAALCRWTRGHLVLRAVLLGVERGAVIRARILGDEPRSVGTRAAAELRRLGASRMLSEWRRVSREIALGELETTS